MVCCLFRDSSQNIRIESAIAVNQQDQKTWFDAATQSLSEIMSKLDTLSPQSQTSPFAPQSLSRECPDPEYEQSRVANEMQATMRYLDHPSTSCNFDCVCRCHIGKKYGRICLSPFQNIIGSISMIYSGWNFAGPRCNVLACRRASLKLFEVIYSRPLISVSVVASAKILASEPTITMSIGRETNRMDEYGSFSALSLVKSRTVPELKQLLQKRFYAVLDVSESADGFSTFHYAFEIC